MKKISINPRRGFVLAFIAIALALLGGAGTAHAQTIGLCFGGGLDAGGHAVGSAIPAGTSAGVVPQTHWNDLPITTQATTMGSFSTLVDSTGAVVPKLAATWGSHLDGSATLHGFGNNFENPGDRSLFSSSLLVFNAAPGDGSPWGIVFLVSGIPYSSYDVYVYSEGEDGVQALVDLNGVYPINGDPVGGTAIQFAHLGGGMKSYVKATGKPSDKANYVHFQGVTGSTLTINAREGNGGLVGIQIVAVSESKPK